MEVIVYYSNEKPLFKRVVLIPDTFDIKSFVSNMKSIFGDNVTINIIIT